ncbi:MAG: phenylalanine--tRNA ligase subunit beta, partial [bacterium]
LILDVKVLPDRACYALSYEGLAREVGAGFSKEDLKFIPKEKKYAGSFELPKQEVIVEEKKLCRRYVSAKVLNISKNDSPAWLKERLTSIGQRSINLAVDLTNFVMFDIGEPMHVFDASKIAGPIQVRPSKKGEKIELLDGRQVDLEEGTLLIADDNGPLVIAGIKGGKRAEVGLHTNSIIIEAANFDPTYIRKMSNKLAIRTESSKRFENNVSTSKALEGMNYFLSLLAKEDNSLSIGEIDDQNFSDESERSIEVPFSKISDMLGIEIESSKIIETLNLAGLRAEMSGNKILVRIPLERKDINIEEDIAEEVGRIFGYDNIPGSVPEIKDLYVPNKNISVQNRIRNFLVQKGFSEVITYSLKESGEIKLANPLASDKGQLRTNLTDAMEEKLSFNLNYSDILGINEIRIFEIGKIFLKDTEKNSLCIGISYKNKKSKIRPNDEIKDIRDELFKTLDLNLNTVCTIDDSGGLIMSGSKQIGTINNKDGVFEIDLDFVTSLVKGEDDVSLNIKSKFEKYQPISIYPYVVRDIAVFVPGENKEEEVLKNIKIQAGELLVKSDLFDVFTKTDEKGEKKTSYAFRLIFQSFNRTLVEKEIEEIMNRLTLALNSKEGWKVR